MEKYNLNEQQALDALYEEEKKTVSRLSYSYGGEAHDKT